ncbi:MAG TPA: hypothetical protein VL403_03010 [Candidatus Kryptonia bacterium]|nr:hypothetical protein [Candidatus Kryptonia bacterium]
MGERGNGLLLVILLLISGVVFTQVPGGSPAAPSKKPSKESTAEVSGAVTERDVCAPSPERLVEQFFGQALPANAGRDALGELAAQHRYSIEFLVATAPDPIDATSGFLFDQHLDAIERAMAAADYLPDRFSLPWQCAQDAKKKCAEKAGAAEPACALATLYRDQPATFLFRKPSSRRLMVLFVVGETPTWGVHKAALQHALDYACVRRRSGRGQQVCDPPVGLLAPTFSGATESLRIALREWLDPKDGDPDVRPPSFRIVSGSATDYGNKATLDALSVDGFHATTASSEAQIGIIRQYLEQLGADPCSVALLKEANTAYGRGATASTRWQDRCGQPHANGARAPEDWLQLPFPISISQVRMAYDRSQMLRPAAAPNATLPRTVLDLSLDDITEPEDVPPPQSSQMTANIADLVLADTLSTISRERIKYVGLLATDVRDTLFLAQQIRTYCPDVRLFSIGSERLYTHPDYSQALEGMLVVSTYPLYGKTQLWTDHEGGRHQRLTFDNNGTEGVYNAALALLGKDDWLVDYATPFHPAAPGTKRRPSLWIAAVGHGGLWPLQFYPEYGQRDYVLDVPRVILPLAQSETSVNGNTVDWGQTRSGFAVTLIAILTLLALANCAAYLFMIVPQFRRIQRVENWSLLEIFRRPQERRYLHEQALYVGVVFFALLVTYSCVARFVFLSVKAAPEEGVDAVMNASVMLCLCSLIVVNAFIIPRVLRRIVAPVVDRIERRLIKAGVRAGLVRTLTTMTMLAVGALAIWRLRPEDWRPTVQRVNATELTHLVQVALRSVWFPQAQGQYHLLFERAGSIVSGLSPVTPLLFLGFGWYVWGVGHLRRIRFLDTLTVTDPLATDTFVGEGITGFETWMRSAVGNPIRCGLRFPLAVVLVALAVLGPCAWLRSRFLPTFDGAGFDRLVQVAFALLYGGVAFAGVQLFSLWYHMRRLLRCLALHPMKAAFIAFPKEIGQLLRRRLYAHVPTVTDLQLPLQQWRALALAFRRLPPPGMDGSLYCHLADIDPDRVASGVDDARRAMEGAAEAEERFRSDLDAAASRWSRVPATRSGVRPLLSAAATQLMAVLQLRWQRGALPRPAADVSSKADGRAPDLSPVEAWLRQAEDFVVIEVVTFLTQNFVHLRNLLMMTTLGMLMMLLTVSSYPFQPQRLLQLFTWSVILPTVGGVITMLVQMDRNEVLSRITGTEPNEIRLDHAFVSSIVTYGVLPVLTLLATMFPQLGGLWGAIEPITRVFK